MEKQEIDIEYCEGDVDGLKYFWIETPSDFDFMKTLERRKTTTEPNKSVDREFLNKLKNKKKV